MFCSKFGEHLYNSQDESPVVLKQSMLCELEDSGAIDNGTALKSSRAHVRVVHSVVCTTASVHDSQLISLLALANLYLVRKEFIWSAIEYPKVDSSLLILFE